MVQPWIKYVIGNGASTYLWVDNWHNLGPLYQKFGDYTGFNGGRSLTNKVASIIHNGLWKWPRPRCAISREIIANTDPNLVPNVDILDSVRWVLDSSGVYSTKSDWQELREVFPIVPSTKCVWFTRQVRRWGFIE